MEQSPYDVFFFTLTNVERTSVLFDAFNEPVRFNVGLVAEKSRDACLHPAEPDRW